MIKLYNTLTKKKEEFTEIEKGMVKLYSCGPTVYSIPHIGNMRSVVFSDIIKRTFEYFGYKVKYINNITDVGHLVSDDDDGEDKMLKASKKEKLDPYEIARKYEDIYMQCLEKLQIEKADKYPRATEHIKEQLDIIEELEKNNFTYQTKDGIYFDVAKFENYGKLSGQSLEEKKAGARVDLNSDKKNPQDFALWKFLIGDNKNHIMKWGSKWGEGFPGWHIECSAMSKKYLGEKFDIHTGGIDHIPVHHENEIAQNTCSGAVKKVNFWMHNAHMLINNEKISKSLGNGYSLFDLEEMGYNSLALREMFLKTHYRKQMNFTFDSLKTGELTIKKINEFIEKYENFKTINKNNLDVENIIKNNQEKFEKALKDDLNTPLALASVNEFMTQINKLNEFSKENVDNILAFMKKTDKVLGLIQKEEKIPKKIIELANKRKQSREDKNWDESDNLRDEIKSLGYEIKDDKKSKDGFILSKI